MIIGVDFDNTIVCYDELFRKVALERGAIPATTPPSKGAVRDYLRQTGQEPLWTELQGYVYGPRMQEASPFPGALEFFRGCKARGVPVFVISHRTLYPYLGERYDLHQAARDWLAAYGFHDAQRIGLPRDHVCFELSKQEKLARIAQMGCTHFIDDLPEFLEEPAFPPGVERLLFDPNDVQPECTVARRMDSWPAIATLLFG